MFKFGFVFPKVVNAVELTPNSTMKTTNNIVRLPHCVNRFNGGVAILFVFYMVMILIDRTIFLCFLL